MLLHSSIAFLIIAFVASFVGFGGIAPDPQGLARELFFICFAVGGVTFFIDTLKNG